MRIRNIFDEKLLKFILVGLVNTAFGTTVMFIFYNIFQLSYWFSSASNYILGSILSYFLNKNFTFRYKKNDLASVMRFILNISICYFLAYGIAKPLAKFLLENQSEKIRGNVAMLIGMCFFVVANYLGQRFFCFKENKEIREKKEKNDDR